MAKEIFIMIPQGGKGETVTHAAGFPGNACQAATAPYIAALGGNVVSDEEVLENRSAETEQVKVH
jgi:hypothetical protein